MSLVIRKNLFPSLFSHYQKSGESTTSKLDWKLKFLLW